MNQSMQSNDRTKSRRRLWLAIGGPCFGAFLLAGIALLRLDGSAGDDAKMPIYTVVRGPLTISVTESGTIKPREQRILKSEVEGSTTILFLIPEGTRVEKGQLLVELDSSKHEDEKIEQEIRVQNAESAFIRAREDLAVVQNQAKSDVEKAELAYKFAEEDLKNYEQGEFPKQLKEAESRITIATQELQREKERLRWSEILHGEKYISETELEADQLAVTKSELDADLARTNRDLLVDFTYKRDLDKLKSNVNQTEMALERTKRKASADILQAQAEHHAKEAEFKRQESKLEKTLEQIAKTRIHAPASGLVVYATSAKGSRRGNVEPLDEGQQVRERQELIYLPTAELVRADVKIHESNVNKVTLGMPVRVTVDALAGKSFVGKVVKIAPLPDAQSMHMNPDLKVFNVEIHINGNGRQLRTGMSCRAEILIERYKDVVSVPIQAVVRVGNQPTVYVTKSREAEERPVEIGLDNNIMVHVVNGLSAGERVLLTPPLASGTVQEEEADEWETASSANSADAKTTGTITWSKTRP